MGCCLVRMRGLSKDQWEVGLRRLEDLYGCIALHRFLVASYWSYVPERA